METVIKVCFFVVFFCFLFLTQKKTKKQKYQSKVDCVCIITAIHEVSGLKKLSPGLIYFGFLCFGKYVVFEVVFRVVCCSLVVGCCLLFVVLTNIF